jgi:TP901 family phage tail tape measure protein
MGQSNSLSSTLVVNMKDNTGGAASSIKRNLRSVEDAEKRFARNRAMIYSRENATVVARERAILAQRTALQAEARQELLATSAMMGRYATVGVLAAGVVAGKAVADYAELERRVNRILINAGKGLKEVKPTVQALQTIAQDTRQGFDKTVVGLETLVASGRSLEDAMAFLPSVATTAQASGAEIADVALSADALAGSMKIAGKDMQEAFDVLVEGGKQGKFELKDMSQYLPSILSSASNMGYEGVDGLKRIVAFMQTLRNKTGNASDAATQMTNILQKVWSSETQSKFKKFNINLEKELKKRTQQGQDLVSAFLDVTEAATKGDSTKLAQLFTDAEVAKGMTALLSQREAIEKLIGVLNNSKGATLKDFQQSISDTQGALDKFGASWNKLWTKVGENVASGTVPVLDKVNNWLDDSDARGRGTQKSTLGDPKLAQWQEDQFAKEYKQRFPDRGPEGWKLDYERMLMQIGRDQAKSVFEFFDRLDLAKPYNEAKYEPGKGPQSPLLGERRSNRFSPDEEIPVEKVPVPSQAKPKPMTAAEVAAARRTETFEATYEFGNGRDQIDSSLALIQARQKKLADRLFREQVRRDLRLDREPISYEEGYSEYEGGRHKAGKDIGPDPVSGPRAGLWRDPATIDPLASDMSGVSSAAAYLAETLRQAVDAVIRDAYSREGNDRAVEAGDRRQFFERETGPRWGVDPQPNALQSITGQVSLIGTPTVITRPSGVQQVSVTNLPQPNITYQIDAPVTIQEATNGAEVARQFASSVKTAIAGTHADMNYQAHA